MASTDPSTPTSPPPPPPSSKADPINAAAAALGAETEPVGPSADLPAPTMVPWPALRAVPAPSHVLPALSGRVQRGPGRPRRVLCAPLASEISYQAALRDALGHHVEADGVVRAADAQVGATELFDALILAVARDQAAIAYRVLHEPGDSRARERARGRRIDALAALSRLVLERRRLEAGSPEIPERVRTRVIDALLNELQRVALEVLGEELAVRLVGGVRAKLGDHSCPPAKLPA